MTDQARLTQSTGETQEFLVHNYGQRLTLLFVVRSFVIWEVVLFFLVQVLTPVFGRGQPWAIGTVLAICSLLTTGAVLQHLAITAWNRREGRKICWSPEKKEFTFYHHHLVEKFWSFGAVVEEVVISASEIRRVKVLSGRSELLRISTTQGLLETSNNELEFYEDLRDLILSCCPEVTKRES